MPTRSWPRPCCGRRTTRRRTRCRCISPWQSLQADSADWSDYASPAHFYLFTLKALAFIRLRYGDSDEALRILNKMAELDPRDSVGASVIRTIAEGVV